MGGFIQLWNRVVGTLKNGPSEAPTAIAVPRNQIDENRNGEMNASFRKDESYFQVLINEMYLRYDRQWLNAIDPVVYVVSEFQYNQEPQLVPFLLGPSLLKKKGVPDQYASRGIIFRNESVSSLHPYRGGGLTLTVILCQARGDNLARPLLGVLEKTTDALGFSPALAPYTKIANILIDGFDSLFSAGGITPLVALRDSFGPNYNILFQPGYFALLDATNVDPAGLWVKDRQLMQGKDWNSLQPYREADYVLYSIVAPKDNVRDDTDSLPFSDAWQQIWKLAGSGKAGDWDEAKRQMAVLNDTIAFSPDLTASQAEKLCDERWDKLKAHHDKAQAHAAMGVDGFASPAQDRLDRIRSRSREILNS